MNNKILAVLFTAGILVVSLSGCATLGPRRIAPDRIDYVEAISESWKKQMLLNIVKLRYFDPPTFLDVTSIINQYGIENQINAEARWYWPAPPTSSAYAGGGGYSRYSDKPTITYTPLSGQKFTKNLLTPIPPVAVISLIQSGWPIDLIFSFAVKTINGVNNSSPVKDALGKDDNFDALIKAMRVVQRAGVTDIRLEQVEEKEAVVFVFSEEFDREKYRTEIETIQSILKTKPDTRRLKIVFGSLPKSDEEMALLTRSLLEIMLEMALYVDAPAKHIEEKRVRETIPFSGSEWETHIRSGTHKPTDAFTAVRYQDHWFWVDNTDMSSKRNFSLLMIFMSLTETEQQTSGPLLTL